MRKSIAIVLVAGYFSAIATGCGYYAYLYPYEAKGDGKGLHDQKGKVLWESVDIVYGSIPSDRRLEEVGKIYLSPPCLSTHTTPALRKESIKKEAAKLGAAIVLFLGNPAKIEHPHGVPNEEHCKADTLTAFRDPK